MHVDFATQERVPKDSAVWYSNVVRANQVHADHGLAGVIDDDPPPGPGDGTRA